MPLEELKSLTLDGGGASFVFHGRMLPVSLLHSSNCSLKDFSIDFKNQHICSGGNCSVNDPKLGILLNLPRG